MWRWFRGRAGWVQVSACLVAVAACVGATIAASSSEPRAAARISAPAPKRHGSGRDLRVATSITGAQYRRWRRATNTVASRLQRYGKRLLTCAAIGRSGDDLGYVDCEAAAYRGVDPAARSALDLSDLFYHHSENACHRALGHYRSRLATIRRAVRAIDDASHRLDKVAVEKRAKKASRIEPGFVLADFVVSRDCTVP